MRTADVHNHRTYGDHTSYTLKQDNTTVGRERGGGWLQAFSRNI